MLLSGSLFLPPVVYHTLNFPALSIHDVECSIMASCCNHIASVIVVTILAEVHRAHAVIVLHLHTCAHIMRAIMSACGCVHVRAVMRTCYCVCLYACVQACARVCVCARAHACVRARVRARV